jgi:transcription elongation factor GreB
MSKAFVRESDEEEDRPEEPQAFPAGFKNYMTPQGHRQLQEELRTLLRVERPKIVDVVSCRERRSIRKWRLHLR